MVTAFLIALYIVGAVVAYKLMASWDSKWYARCMYALIWPLVGILYGIHWLHNNL